MKLSIIFFVGLSVIILPETKAQQNNGKISGFLTDDRKQPVSASITLKNDADTSFAKHTATDENGKFSFEHLPYGNYTFTSTAIGFQSINEKIKLSSGKYLFDKNFIMRSAANDLGSIIITGRKPLIERLGSKTVMHVENSLLATGNTALEVLAKMPGVSINQDGIIRVNGKSGIHVLIDGKSTFLSDEQLTKRLKSLSSTELKLIELNTNPSAMYDAEGNAGIINIKLKKGSSTGTNGDVNLGFGYSKNPKSEAGLSVNHRNKYLNIFGNFSNNNDKYQEDLNINRVVKDGISATYFHQYNTQIRASHNHNYKFGLDYTPDSKNTIGFLTTGYFNNGHDSSNGITSIGPGFTQADSSVTADNPSVNQYRNQAYNLNYKLVLDTLGQDFSVDLDYAKYRNEEYTVYQNYFFKTGGFPFKLPSVFRNQTPSYINIKAVKIDYSLPVNLKTKLNFGIKSSWVSTDNEFRFENLLDSRWENDLKRSNRFIYDENINAAYANFKHNFKKTSIEIGLRAEQTNSKGNSIEEQKVVKRSYLNFFPNFAVNQTLSESNQVDFSYSRRIDRPDYKSLNPFIYFVDLYTFSQGNPFLNPQYTNVFRLAYNHKKELNISLGYSITNNLIIDVLLPDDAKKALYQTVRNIDKQFSYHLTVSYPTIMTKFWSMDNTIISTYNQLKSTNLGGAGYDRRKVNFSVNSSHNFTITNSTTAELSGEFISAQIYGTYAVKPYYGIDFGLKKSFSNNRMNIKFALNDILNSRIARISSALPSLNYNLSQKKESRVFRVSLNYNFGSTSVKATRDRKTSVTDEEGRVK